MKKKHHMAPANDRRVWRCEPCTKAMHHKCKNEYKGMYCYCRLKGHLMERPDK